MNSESRPKTVPTLGTQNALLTNTGRTRCLNPLDGMHPHRHRRARARPHRRHRRCANLTRRAGEPPNGRGAARTQSGSRYGT